MINRVVTGLLVSSAVAAGVWLGYNGVLPFGSTAGATITGGGLPYYLCPATAEAGEVHDGDRVLVTGVDESGNWLEIRDPERLEARVWVQREYVDPDRDIDVPVAPCSLEVGRFDRLASPDETTTTTTTTTTLPDGETTTTTTTTTTTVPSTTTTTAPAPTTSTAPTTTTTAAPAPVIGEITRNPDTIIEEWDGFPETCGGPKTSAISVQVANATAATMSWEVGSVSGSVPMARNGSVFAAELGPFDENTVSSGHLMITVTITASGPGGQTTKQTQVRLDDCPFG